MADGVKVPVSIDTNGIQEGFDKTAQSIGKATSGIARGIATAVGASMGPFGELIEKADALRAALGGASTASKLLAGGVAAAMIGTVFSVKKAVEGWYEMSDAIDAAKKSAKDLADQTEKIQASHAERVLKIGVQPGQESNDTLRLEGRKSSLVGVPGDAAILEMKQVHDALADIKSGAARRRWDEGQFQKGLSPEAQKFLNETKPRVDSVTQLEGERSKLRAGIAEESGKAGRDGLQAVHINRMVSDLGEVEAALESAKRAAKQVKDEAARQWDIKDLQETQRAKIEDALDQFFTGPLNGEKAAPSGMPAGYGVSGLTSVGGGGRIYGVTPGANGPMDEIASASKQTAENTRKIAESQTLIQ